jgi:hypothetical protein
MNEGLAMTSVLVSGDKRLIDNVAAALDRPEVSVVRAERLVDLPGICAESGSGCFDAYVQMPANFTISGDTAIDRVRNFYAQGVLARFTALRDALPSLKPSARVVFVLAQLPGEVGTQDDRNARHALVRVLARAAAADIAEGRLTVSVQESGLAPSEIAAIALGEFHEHDALLERLSSLDYDDWRVELIGLVGVQG